MWWLLLIFLAVILFWGWFETWRIRVVKTRCESSNLPNSFNGYRIVLIGGLHLRRNSGWTRRIQDQIQRLNPDILLIGGNVKATHRSGNESTHELLSRFLEPLDPPGGILAVQGYRDRKKFWEELPEESRIELLSTSHKTIDREGGRLTFLGIQTAHASHLDRGINQLREALEPLGSGDYRILVGQSADLLRVAQGQPIDLILAVDNLHYQIRIPGWGVPRRDTKVPYSWGPGWVKEGLLSLYLNPGLGTRWIPFRFFYRPEITLIELTKK
ncbi:MAG: metallophosphoesterase [Candidatus Omnitrophica bacterium]|nr:metallophosphoesterase [Candidatus Omnitrophota bacterium]